MAGQLLYQPSLLTQLMVRFTHRSTHSTEKLWYAFIVPEMSALEQPAPNWGDYQSQPFDLNTLELKPDRQAYYGDLPHALITHSGFTDIRRDLLDWVYEHYRLTIYHNPALDLHMSLDETRSVFMERVQNEARRRQQEDLNDLAARYNKVFDRLEDKADRKTSRIEAEEGELASRKQEALVSTGESVLRLLKGRLYETVSRIARLRRYSQQSSEQVEVLEEDLAVIEENLDEAEARMDKEIEAIHQKWTNAARQIEEVAVTPNKKDITLQLFGIGWVPHWHIRAGQNAVILPASQAGLASQQMLNRSQAYTTT
jgi:broad specificity phosphatase PhoE